MLDSAVKAFSAASRAVEYETSSLLERLSTDFQILSGTAQSILRMAQRLRYEVYCVENSFEDPTQNPDLLEQDEFDAHAVHSVLIHRASGEAVGTVRLVLPRTDDLHRSFPLQNLSNHPILRGSQRLPLHSTGEVSRFCISRTLSRRASAVGAFSRPSQQHEPAMAAHCGPLMRLGLLQALVRMSARYGITHWCALMEPQLIRMLAAMAIHGEAVGRTIEHHGLRQPYLYNIESFLRGMRCDRPAFWEVLTLKGALYSGD